MHRRSTMIAVIVGVSLIAGCDKCALSGCEPCEEPCNAYASPCGSPEYGTDTRGTDTRTAQDYIADLRSNDRAARDHAVDMLARMGPERLPDVGELFSDPDPAVRFS